MNPDVSATASDRPMADLAALPGREDTLARLQDALRGEHALIVQLMSHGYRLGDPDLLHALEGISRQDMRHFKWLAETVVRLGGTPTLERGPMELTASTPLAWLNADVAAVETRLAAYRSHIETLDPNVTVGPEAEIRQLLERIVADKIYHREKLLGECRTWEDRHVAGDELARAALGGPLNEAARHGTPDADAATVGFLEFAIGHEYEVILQYLHHAFLLEDQWSSRVLEDVAIEEMRHLGWLSEALVERGGCPFWEAKRLELDVDAIRMLELDQQREIEVEADYAQMTAAMSDTAIRRLFDRIGDHERFHAGTLGRLIERLKARKPAEATSVSNQPRLAATPTAQSQPQAPPPPRGGGCPYTVGSLFGVPQV